MAMTNYRIIFTENDVSLPDDSSIGIVGEHNAGQLVLTLPDSMVEGMTYHTVTLGGVESALIVSEHESTDGAYRVGNVIYFPLSSAWTQKPIVDLYVTAYKQVGQAVQIVDKTPNVYGLRFSPSGTAADVVPGGLAAEVYALEQQFEAMRETMFTSADLLNILSTFSIDDEGFLCVDTSTGYAMIDEEGNLCVDVGTVAKINSDGYLEVAA